MRTTGDMFTATATRGATWLAVGALAFTAVSAAGQEGGDAGWYPAVRAEIAGLQTELLSCLAGADLPEGARAQAQSQVEGIVEGLLRNLDAEIAGVGPRLSAAQLEHGPQEDHFCSAANVAFRLVERGMEDPADADGALTAAAQCREAYWGAVSLPVSEELEGLRNLCVIARDRIVEQHDDPSAVWERERAAVYAVARCAAWRGAAWVRYSLTGSHYKDFADANSFVLELTVGIINSEYGGPLKPRDGRADGGAPAPAPRTCPGDHILVR